MRYTEACVTVEIDGSEKDVYVRAFVEVGPGVSLNGWGAILDSDADIMIGGEWQPAESCELGSGDHERISDALCDRALEDYEP